jgi:hypothetical protein
MLDNNFHILTQSESLQLAQEKIDARQHLLKLPPLEAQAIVNSIIDPTLWKPDFSHGFEFNELNLNDNDSED